jgi:hypothetical protein
MNFNYLKNETMLTFCFLPSSWMAVRKPNNTEKRFLQKKKKKEKEEEENKEEERKRTKNENKKKDK